MLFRSKIGLFTVKTLKNGSTKVAAGKTTSVFSATAATPTDMRTGRKVLLVRSGPTRATQVILMPVGAKAGAKVTAVKAGTITITGLTGKPVAISTVGAEFAVAQPAKLSAVKVGSRIVAVGVRSPVGVVARSIVVLPKAGTP